MLQAKMQGNNISDVSPRSKVVYITSSATVTEYEMEPYEMTLVMTTDNANDITVTLPPVGSCMGGVYTIRLVTDGGKDVIIEDNNDDADLSDITLDTADDYVVLYSDGIIWYELAGETA
jgi:hypothetical protein